MVGAAKCVIVDSDEGPLVVDVVELTAQMAVLATTRVCGSNEFIDITLRLSAAPPMNLFAQVTESKSDTLHVRWMHMDNTEEEALVESLRQWRAGDFDKLEAKEANEEKANEEDILDIFGDSGTRAIVKKAVSQRSGTRRVTKPRLKPATEDVQPSETSGKDGKTRSKTVTFEQTAVKNRIVSPLITADADAGALDKKPMAEKSGTRRIVRPDKKAAGAAGGEPAEKTHRETRRVARPAVRKDKRESIESADKIAALNRVAANQDSAHDVVITTTQRFESMKDEKKRPKKVHKNVLGDDGKLDVGASIRNATKTVSVAELAERHSKLKVLNMGTIKALIGAAVREAIESLGQALNEQEKDRLLKEAEDGFKERLEAFKAEKKGLEAQSERLRGQLDKAQDLLQDEKKRTIEKDQFTVSDAGIQDLEKQFERMLRGAAKSGVTTEIEDSMRVMVTGLLDGEREKIAEQARQAQGDAIELLERKVKRLASSLDETESERDQARRHAQSLAAAGGGDVSVQNMYDVGLADDDSNKEAKMALLKDIFAQNKEMRDHLKAKGTTLKTRARPQKIKQAEASPSTSSPTSTVATEKSDEDTVKDTVKDTVEDQHTDSAQEQSLETPVESALEPVMDSASAAKDAKGGESGENTEEENPDDMPWEPGQTVNPEAEFADDDDDDEAGEATGVKKIVVTAVEPPRLERKKKAPQPQPESLASDTPAEEAPVASEPDSEPEENPDDMMWTPSASDAVEEETVVSGVKKISATTHSEPPPLDRGS